MKVVAVIGDVVASKTLARRGAFQRRLDKALQRANAEAASLASPYTITLGDEFQAVYREAKTVLGDIVAILAEIHPVRARFALGVGELTTRINPEQALGMDGPAFHQAREALTGLKESGRLLRVAGENIEAWALANHALNLISHQLEGWTQNRLLVLAGLLRGQPVKDVSVRISRVAVYKNIRAAALDDVVGICHELASSIDRELRRA